MSHPLPPKKEVALALLERSSVHVHLDPRAAGVVVPPWLKRQPQLVLQVGLNMPVPIPDLRLDDGGVTCTLSFNRSPFYCVVPWTSVYAMVGDDGRGMVWPDDVPPEVAQPRGSQARPERAKPAAAAVASVAAVPSGPSGPSSASNGSVARLPKKSVKKSAARASADETSASDGVDGAAGVKKKRVAKKRAAGEGADAGSASAKAKATGKASGKKPSANGRGHASDDGRAILVAVPAAKNREREGAHDGARDLRDRSPSGASDDAATRPSPSPSPSPARSPGRAPSRPSTPSTGARPGPKRELPPYLRVVK